jgi:hypothetical protein
MVPALRTWARWSEQAGPEARYLQLCVALVALYGTRAEQSVGVAGLMLARLSVIGRGILHDRGASPEEVEVAALVRLQDPVFIEPSVAAVILLRG